MTTGAVQTQRPPLLRTRSDWMLRVLCFLLCIPSGGALLLKVYGVMPMQTAAVEIFVPCALALASIWWGARETSRGHLAAALAIGFWGGLAGTIGYDLIRIPFLLMGQRVFAPISAYGVWIMDASSSSRFTDVVGWVYHFSNGITFGIMYALFMRSRHWIWAIGWAMLLETIALLSPFAAIFSLYGNWSAIGIAYLGHVAYGLPLGFLVYRWDGASSRLRATPPFLKWFVVIVAFSAVVGPLISADRVERDRARQDGTFLVDGTRLNPSWLRNFRGDLISVENPMDRDVTLLFKTSNTRIPLLAGERRFLLFEESGIYQVLVETEGRTRSSFLIVEPVEDLSDLSQGSNTETE